MLRRFSRDGITHILSKLTGLPGIRNVATQIESLARGNFICVVRYFRVLPSTIKIDKHYHRQCGLALSPQQFEGSIVGLQKRFQIISMQEAINRIRGGLRLDQNYCVITFDEGYAETLEQALPILRKHQLPACMFTTTGHFSRQHLLWNDRVSDYVTQHAPEPLRLGWMDKTLFTSTPPETIQSTRQILRHLCWCDQPRRNRLLRSFPHLRNFKPTESLDRLISQKTIRSLRNNGLLGFASHGHDHMPLATLNLEAQKKELSLSRDLLSDAAGPNFVDAFSYPFGYPDTINSSVLDEVQKAGYQAAFTSQGGIVRPGNCLFSMPRVRIANHQGIEHLDEPDIANLIDEVLLVALGAEEKLTELQEL